MSIKRRCVAALWDWWVLSSPSVIVFVCVYVVASEFDGPRDAGFREELRRMSDIHDAHAWLNWLQTGLSWLVLLGWLALVWRNQSFGKRKTRLFVLDGTGRLASGMTMLKRDVLLRGVFLYLIPALLAKVVEESLRPAGFPVGRGVDILWTWVFFGLIECANLVSMFASKDHRAIWDRFAGTYVGYALPGWLPEPRAKVVPPSVEVEADKPVADPNS